LSVEPEAQGAVATTKAETSLHATTTHLFMMARLKRTLTLDKAHCLPRDVLIPLQVRRSASDADDVETVIGVEVLNRTT